MDALLQDLGVIVEAQAPHLRRLFETFTQEALFGRAWLQPQLASLKPGEKILEVGAGLMILSCQLVKEGFDVTALEPIGVGFTAFVELQTIVLNYADSIGIHPEIRSIPIEDLADDGVYDFAFSINVMEHVGNVPLALRSVVRALKAGGEYKFTCPNYTFPYEPHFNIPTLFSKSLTEYAFHRKILGSKNVPDPEGTWRSLNWITVSQIRSSVGAVVGASVYFDRNLLRDTLSRVVTDKEFASRRSRWTRILIEKAVKMGLHNLVVLIPPMFQPIINCTVRRAL